MFENFLKKQPLADCESAARADDAAAVRRALAAVESAFPSSTNEFAHFLAFVSPAAEKYLEAMAQLAQKLTVQRFGRTINLFVPVYLSNKCGNACAYCGFNRNQKVSRRTLSCKEAIGEVEHLTGKGFRHLLLVTGDYREEVTSEYLEQVVSAASDRAASVSLEVYAMDDAEYAAMVKAGADGLVLYQETYDPALYARLHDGPKADYTWRLAAPERAANAGFHRVGLGALLGLRDWRSEAIAMALHARHLLKHHWRTFVTLSFARVQPAVPGFSVPAPVPDASFVRQLLAFRLFFPDCGIVLTTREPASLRDRLIPLGVTMMSAESRTSPGAYALEEKAGEQFMVDDRRTVEEVAAAIRAAGYDPVWKDWDRAFLRDRQAG